MDPPLLYLVFVKSVHSDTTHPSWAMICRKSNGTLLAGVTWNVAEEVINSVMAKSRHHLLGEYESIYDTNCYFTSTKVSVYRDTFRYLFIEDKSRCGFSNRSCLSY